jgi:hypothetical protein
MRLSFLGKALIPLQIAALLLIQVNVLGAFAPVWEKGKKASHHRCACPPSCSCAASHGLSDSHCCPCCAGWRKKTAAVGHQSPQGRTTICISAFPCGGPKELNINSSGQIKFILTHCDVDVSAHPVLLVHNTQIKPESLYFQPPDPPPKINVSSSPSFI